MRRLSQPGFEATLAEYFHERLREQRPSPRPHEDTLWYTGNLLARFGDSNQLFSYDRGAVDIRPLALLYQDAHEARDQRERCLILRQLGDLALFLGALFPERFARRGIRGDYVVGMGGGAYDYLSENARQNRHVFSELASLFTHIQSLVARVCAQPAPSEAGDVLDLYQRWRQSRDPQLGEQLRALGISLDETNRLH